jgi:hypothetical protein
MDHVPKEQEQEGKIMTEKIRQQFLSAARAYLLLSQKAGGPTFPSQATSAAACC